MTFLLDVLMPDPDDPPPFCKVGEMVDVAVPIVDATVRLPTEVEVITVPSEV